ncbi:hypothetical protein CYMTET_33210, partial [Cymbomonas tetramitiformis]
MGPRRQNKGEKVVSPLHVPSCEALSLETHAHSQDLHKARGQVLLPALRGSPAVPAFSGSPRPVSTRRTPNQPTTPLRAKLMPLAEEHCARGLKTPDSRLSPLKKDSERKRMSKSSDGSVGQVRVPSPKFRQALRRTTMHSSYDDSHSVADLTSLSNSTHVK